MKRYLFLLLALVFAVSASADNKKPARKKPLCASPSHAQTFLNAEGPKSFRALSVTDTITKTIGKVVVLQADPDLLIVPNPFDLIKNAVRFTPAIRNKYLYSLIPYSFNADASDTLPMRDDDSVELTFRNFQFPFGGRLHSRCFVNSNGNITFDAPDTEPPNIDTLLQGPPRIAPFFADLDPESSGTIFVSQTVDTIIISWLKVPEFFNHEQFAYGQNTFQVVLYKDGRIDVIYSEEMTATQALVGIVPGYGKSQLRLVDFTKGAQKGRLYAAVLENFRNYESVDIPQVMKELYKNYGDDYDFVTVFSNFDLTPIPGAQAFAINVQNDVRGIGNPSGRGRAIFRDNGRYGSAGRLQNITFLGNIHQYPVDPNQALPDTYTSLLQILGHEVGHRWLSYINTSRDGLASNILLGRDASHWSFFLDSDGSLMEGNEIVSRSSNSFATGRPFSRFSKMDLYLMGLIPASEVPQSFVVEGADQFSPSFDFLPESAPEPDVTFQGSARPVRIEDIVAVNGKRKPDTTSSKKSFTHLFLLIEKSDFPVSIEEISMVDQWRSTWETYFFQATAGKARISTNVQ